MRNKRANHVEEIISFVFFITFIMIIIFYIAYPDSSKETKSSMEILKNSVINQTTENVIQVYIANSTSKTSENCIEVNESFLDASMNATVKSINGSGANSKRESGKIYVDWSSSQNSFVAYYSKYNFNSTELAGTPTCQDGKIKAVLSKREFIEGKILNLINNTLFNYNSTKNNLDVSRKYEFNIQFEYENKTRVGKNVTETNADIYVKENLINYLDSNANEKEGKIIISLW